MVSGMTKQARMAFLRDMYTGRQVNRHAAICQPAGRPLNGDFEDFTVSTRHLSAFVPEFVRVYENAVNYHQSLGDDGVELVSVGTGTQIFAAALGSAVHTFKDSPPCALPRFSTLQEAEQLEEPDVFSNPVLMRIFEMTRLVQKELGRDAILGPCDFQTGFDTACLVMDKAELMMAMHGGDEEKEAVKRLSGKCARLLKRFLMEYRREFPNMSPCHCPWSWVPPELGPWLSNDECGAMSNEMFEEFCLPELIDLAETFGGLGMHCCADAEHQFPLFKKIPNFYAFNRVSAKRGYLPLLEHFAGPGSPVHTLAWIHEQTMRELVDKAPAGTRFVFVNMDGDVEKAKVWLENARTFCGNP